MRLDASRLGVVRGSIEERIHIHVSLGRHEVVQGLDEAADGHPDVVETSVLQEDCSIHEGRPEPGGIWQNEPNDGLVDQPDDHRDAVDRHVDCGAYHRVADLARVVDCARILGNGLAGEPLLEDEQDLVELTGHGLVLVDQLELGKEVEEVHRVPQLVLVVLYVDQSFHGLCGDRTLLKAGGLLKVSSKQVLTESSHGAHVHLSSSDAISCYVGVQLRKDIGVQTRLKSRYSRVQRAIDVHFEC